MDMRAQRGRGETERTDTERRGETARIKGEGTETRAGRKVTGAGARNRAGTEARNCAGKGVPAGWK